MRATERVAIIMQRILALLFLFSIPLSFFHSFTLCTFNKSENVSVRFKSNKAVDDLCQKVAGEKKSEARFERQFQGSDASINPSYLYRISFE